MTRLAPQLPRCLTQPRAAMFLLCCFVQVTATVSSSDTMDHSAGPDTGSADKPTKNLTDHNENTTTGTPKNSTEHNCLEGDCQGGHGKSSIDGVGEYDGLWRDGLYNGKGRFTFKSGASYYGDWVNDEAQGVWAACLVGAADASGCR